MVLGQVLYDLRNRAGLSQEALAEAVGVSRQAVAKWEADQALPELGNLLALARHFGTSLDRIVSLATGDPYMAAGSGGAPLGATGGGVRAKAVPDDGAAEQAALVAFLLRAKRATYAGHGAEVPPSRPLSHDLRHEEGELLYIDSYLGSEAFSGEEALWRSGVPLWSMNYVGRVLGEGFSGDFLKESLTLVGAGLPYRGPELHVSGDRAYHCRVGGDFSWFEGEEEIYFAGRKVYECRFHGGTLR